MPKNKFEYQRRTIEDIKARANYRGGSFDSYLKAHYKKYKIREGKNVVRILPPTWPKANHFGYTIWVNYGIGADNQSYLSLSKMKNEKDPIAEARIAASREGDEKLARALDPRERVLVWVIDRQAEDEGPQLWDMPLTVDKAVSNLSVDEDTREILEIDEPTEGHDFRFYKEGQGLMTKYPAEKMKLLAQSPIHSDEGQMYEWLQYVQDNSVPNCLQYYDYEHISSTFDGQARVAEDDDVAPKRPANKPPRRVPDEDEEDNEPKPIRGSNGAPKSPVSEPDEEVDEDGVVHTPPAKPTGGSIRDRLAARQRVLSKRPEIEEEE